MITFGLEYELNRGWIYDDENGDAIGEINFVVPGEWLKILFEEHYRKQYDDIEQFLDAYEPETEGEFIYNKAIEDGKLIEDIGVVMY